MQFFLEILTKSYVGAPWRIGAPPTENPGSASEILDLLVSLQYIEMIFVITYSLPELPYPQDGLAPWIEAQTVDVHYNGHHKAYATNMNAALQKWREEVM